MPLWTFSYHRMSAFFLPQEREIFHTQRNEVRLSDFMSFVKCVQQTTRRRVPAKHRIINAKAPSLTSGYT